MKERKEPGVILEQQQQQHSGTKQTARTQLDMVMSYRYPKSTPGAQPGNGKFWHQLNQVSKEALKSVQQWVDKEKLDLKELSTTGILLSYFKATVSF